MIMLLTYITALIAGGNMNKKYSVTEKYEALQKAAKLITSSLDLQVVMENLSNIYREFTQCERVLVMRFHKETNERTIIFEFGPESVGLIGERQKMSEWMSGLRVVYQCFISRKTEFLFDSYSEHRKINVDKIAIPMLIEDELIGFINLESTIPNNFSTLQCIDLLEDLTSFAAIALVNSENYQEMKSNKQELMAMYEETTAINEELNITIMKQEELRNELDKKNQELNEVNNVLKNTYLETVISLANAIEASDPYTSGHCQRVTQFSLILGKQLGLSKEDMIKLEYAAILHDIGKIGIPEGILQKNGKLTEEEYDLVKKHPQIGVSILGSVPFLKESIKGILQHHERIDGKGYPGGLKGEEISLFARILCIADAYDAMTSTRPYRSAMSTMEAIDEIRKGSGKQFDKDFAEVFIKLLGTH